MDRQIFVDRLSAAARMLANVGLARIFILRVAPSAGLEALLGGFVCLAFRLPVEGHLALIQFVRSLPPAPTATDPDSAYTSTF